MSCLHFILVLALLCLNKQGVVQGDEQFGYVFIQPSGNRYVQGEGSFVVGSPVVLKFGGEVTWVTGVYVEETGDLIVGVVLVDGSTGAARIDTDTLDVEYDSIEPANIGGRVPVLKYDDETDTIEFLVDPMGSSVSGVMPLETDGAVLASVSPEGNLQIIDIYGNRTAVDLQGLTSLNDARIILTEDKQIILVLEPTNRYFHGILGDQSEGDSLAIITLDEDFSSTPFNVSFMSSPIPKVHEQLNAIYTEWNDDTRVVISTIADISEGAKLISYDAQTGQVWCEGPSIGQGFRWRNQMAVAPTGPNGELELIDVLTPHIGGTVEYFQAFPEERSFKLVAKSQPVYTSHVIGSRNTDMGFVGDVNGDGILEVLVPTIDRYDIVALQRVGESGVEEVQRLNFGGDIVSSNLIGVQWGNYSMAVVAGFQSGQVVVWV